MNMRSEFFLLLFLVGCGPAIVDPKLAPYFQRFSTAIGVDTNGVNGAFVPVTRPAIAQCVIDGSRTVQVDPDYWATMDDNGKEELLFHELGHCVLFLQHIFTFLPNTCPTSIMYPYIFGDSECYINNRQYYWNELKSHKN